MRSKVAVSAMNPTFWCAGLQPMLPEEAKRRAVVPNSPQQLYLAMTMAAFVELYPLSRARAHAIQAR